MDTFIVVEIVIKPDALDTLLKLDFEGRDVYLTERDRKEVQVHGVGQISGPLGTRDKVYIVPLNECEHSDYSSESSAARGARALKQWHGGEWAAYQCPLCGEWTTKRA